MSFQSAILIWYAANKRDLPWRSTQDPYVIWLSEIILQQTRVEQGLPYFKKFVEAYPSVSDFASASIDEILKLWQGLGYYSRGRNMWSTAQEVQQVYNGKFPSSYAELIKLKGIGDYTASAIASFSTNENKAVLDGNVFRVLARYFGISEEINSSAGKKIFANLAQELIQDQQAIDYNQAIMEFGAIQCKPKSPNCEVCPLKLSCVAFQQNLVNVLPKKIKAQKARPRYFNYFLITEDDYLYIRRRPGADIWEGLYDLPLIETPSFYAENQTAFHLSLHENFGKDLRIMPLWASKQLLSHQIIYAQFFALENYMINFNQQGQIKLASVEEFKKLAHPKIIADFLQEYLTT